MNLPHTLAEHPNTTAHRARLRMCTSDPLKPFKELLAMAGKKKKGGKLNAPKKGKGKDIKMKKGKYI